MEQKPAAWLRPVHFLTPSKAEQNPWLLHASWFGAAFTVMITVALSEL